MENKMRTNDVGLRKADLEFSGSSIVSVFKLQLIITPCSRIQFSTKVNTLKLDEEYIAKEVIFRFRHSQCSFPIKDCIVHSIVRGYIEAGFVDRLIPLMQDKDQYGLLPDDQAMCILLNYLLTEKKYAEAGQVAYEVMLQEDYNHILKNMLALIAAVKHFTHTCTFKRYEPQQLGDEVMKRQLKSKSGTENDIEKAVEDFIWNQKLPKYEETDTQILKKNYEKWMRDRERKFEVATRRVLVADVEGRVQERLEVLQERQELLEYFDNLPEIRFLQKYRKEEVEVVEKQEEFVQAPGERNIKLKIKKK
ncbi:RT27-like protein [Mya arenaria]|uniref:RT27-like protein n=1 Tax=Mya arenaria TaxID=6604 RepID=A0ABY7DSP7_MYAAR|nr:RT27-like protein [Mya arenaria]